MTSQSKEKQKKKTFSRSRLCYCSTKQRFLSRVSWTLSKQNLSRRKKDIAVMLRSCSSYRRHKEIQNSHDGVTFLILYKHCVYVYMPSDTFLKTFLIHSTSSFLSVLYFSRAIPFLNRGLYNCFDIRIDPFAFTILLGRFYTNQSAMSTAIRNARGTCQICAESTRNSWPRLSLQSNEVRTTISTHLSLSFLLYDVLMDV